MALKVPIFQSYGPWGVCEPATPQYAEVSASFKKKIGLGQPQEWETLWFGTQLWLWFRCIFDNFFFFDKNVELNANDEHSEL